TVYIGGTVALQCQPASGNAYVGGAGSLNSTSGANTGVGVGALGEMNANASNDTAVGENALQSNTGGAGNTAFGFGALGFVSTGSQNVAVGAYSGYDATASSGISTGYGNTFLGSHAGTPADLTNATAIGYLATVGANDSLVLGGRFTDGNNVAHVTLVGIGTSTPNRPLSISAFASNAELVSFNDSSGTTKYHLNMLNGGLTFAETTQADGRIYIAPGGHIGFNTTTPDTNHVVTVNGDLQVNGKVDASVKSFRIDDPLDPAHKELYHASIESSEMMNLYTGMVRLNARGQAVVEMPKWFEALNGDFRYQLTAMDSPAPGLYI